MINPKFALEELFRPINGKEKLQCKFCRRPPMAGLTPPAATSCGVAARRADFAIAKSGIKKITAENFRKYGRIIEYSGKRPKNKNLNLFRIVLKENKRYGWRIAYLVLRDKKIDRLERHPGSFESFEPVRGSSVIYLARKKNSKAELFYLNKPVILKKGIWHGVVTLTPESEIKITENAEVESLFRPIKA